MTPSENTDHAAPSLGKRGAFEGVARRPDAGGTPARMTLRSSLRPTANRPHHSPQRWVEKVGCSIKGSDTPQVAPVPNPSNYRHPRGTLFDRRRWSTFRPALTSTGLARKRPQSNQTSDEPTGIDPPHLGARM